MDTRGQPSPRDASDTPALLSGSDNDAGAGGEAEDAIAGQDNLGPREMEIDPNTRSGQKVFPEFDESFHLVYPFDLHRQYWTTWLACDPHPRRAHAFVWLSVNRLGEMVIPWSWWPEATNKMREQNGDSRLLAP